LDHRSSCATGGDYDYPFKRTIIPTSIPDMADDLVSGSVRLQVLAGNGFTIWRTPSCRSSAVGFAREITYTTDGFGF